MLSMTLEIVEGLQKGKKFTVDSTESLIIGRSKSSNLQIGTNDRLVSRNHCILEIHRDECVITDLNSRNGTLVNEVKITTQPLNNMDEIKVGSTVLRVYIENSENKIFICSACGNHLPEDDTGIHAREVEHEEILCSRCWKIKLDAMVKVERSDFFASLGLHRETYACSKCSAEISAIADSDGLACVFADSTYACPNCINELRKNPQVYDLDDSYLILKEIGRGGMGVVHRAIHKATGRLCALKKIHPTALDDPRNIKIFEREMMVQSRVVHPNLVRIMDKGIVSRTYYFVMEYVQGGSVPALLNNAHRGMLDPRTACIIIVDVLNGLHALHTNGFIHRDIKPSNILMTKPKEGGLGMAKICDYGLAKSFVKSGNSFLDITKTQGGFAGSVMYMSPEIIRNFKYAKPTVDLYAAGVSLYFMLTGKYTVDISDDGFKPMGKGMPAMQRHPLDLVMEEDPIPILSRRPGIAKSLAAVVDKSVSKNAANGFQEAVEFKEALETVMESEGWKR
ncbi:MAG: serine/threonine-protein kinase [Nitrospirota bacterium]